MQHSAVVNMPNSGDKSFGVPAKKVWKAHFHLTLSNVSSEELMKAAKIIGAKCTTIDLHRDTTHFSGYRRFETHAIYQCTFCIGLLIFIAQHIDKADKKHG